MAEVTVLEASPHKKRIIDYLNSSLAFQKLNYRNRNIQGYAEINCYEDEDKICITDLSFNLMMGNNGAFKKRKVNSGLTFYKKGRSSGRLVFWKSQNRNYNNFDSNLYKHLLIKLGKYDNYITNIKEFVSEQMFTKGAYSMIACGKITTCDQFYDYFNKYSLRGYGISKNNTKYLKEYYSNFGKYMGNQLLRTSIEPNHFLVMSMIELSRSKHKLHAQVSHDFLDIIEALGIKVDWSKFISDKHNVSIKLFNENTEFIKKCRHKYDALLKISNLWEQGSTIQSIYTNDLPF